MNLESYVMWFHCFERTLQRARVSKDARVRISKERSEGRAGDEAIGEQESKQRRPEYADYIFIDAGYIIERQVDQTWILLQSIQGIGFDFFFIKEQNKDHP